MASSTGRIFVSYRQQDTAWPASALYQRLVERFGEQQVFKDIDNIRLGEDFVQKITEEVEACDILLALIGRGWLQPDENGRRRIDEPNDFVRLEIKTALDRNVMLIPILVDGAAMPPADSLPSDISALVRRQALGLNPSLFRGGTDELLDVIDNRLNDHRDHDDLKAERPTTAPIQEAQSPALDDNPWSSDMAARYLRLLGKRNPEHLTMIIEAHADDEASIDRASIAECLERDMDARMTGITRPFATALKVLAARDGMDSVSEVPVYPWYEGEGGYMTHLVLEDDFDAVLADAMEEIGNEKLSELTGYEWEDDTGPSTVGTLERYRVSSPAGTSAPLAKNRAVLSMVQELVQLGVQCEAIATVAGKSAFRAVPGELEGDALWSAFANLHGKPDEHRRLWFVDDPLRQGGQSWILANNVWGPKTDRVFTELRRLSDGAVDAHSADKVPNVKPRFCPHCGDPVDVDETSCDKCGTRLI